MTRIRCYFRPQAWVRDNAIEVDAQGPRAWDMDAPNPLPAPHSYASDELRHSDTAPTWIQDWSGPFEVDYEVIEPTIRHLYDVMYRALSVIKESEHADEHAELLTELAELVSFVGDCSMTAGEVTFRREGTS